MPGRGGPVTRCEWRGASKRRRDRAQFFRACQRDAHPTLAYGAAASHDVSRASLMPSLHDPQGREQETDAEEDQRGDQ